MKLTTEIIALCEYATVSREGKLSINGIFDELRVTKFPGGLARAFLVATVHGKPETSYKLQIKIEHKEKTTGSVNLDIHTSPNGKNNIVTELVNVPFEKAGDYQFVIYNGDEEVGSTLLKVFDVAEQKTVEYKLPN